MLWKKKEFITLKNASSQGCFGVGHEKIVKNINFSSCGKQYYYKAFRKCTFFGLLAHYDGWTENSLPHSFYGFFNICSKSTGIIFNVSEGDDALFVICESIVSWAIVSPVKRVKI